MLATTPTKPGRLRKVFSIRLRSWKSAKMLRFRRNPSKPRRTSCLPTRPDPDAEVTTQGRARPAGGDPPRRGFLRAERADRTRPGRGAGGEPAGAGPRGAVAFSARPVV